MIPSNIARIAKSFTPVATAIIQRQLSHKPPLSVDGEYFTKAIRIRRTAEAAADLTERSMIAMGYTPSEVEKSKKDFFKTDEEILQDKVQSDAKKIVAGLVENGMPEHYASKAIIVTEERLHEAHKLKKKDEVDKKLNKQLKLIKNVEKRVRRFEDALIDQSQAPQGNSSNEGKTAHQRLQGVETKVSRLEIIEAQSRLQQSNQSYLYEAVKAQQESVVDQRRTTSKQNQRINELSDRQNQSDEQVALLKAQLNIQGKVINQLLQERGETYESFAERLEGEDKSESKTRR